MCEKNIENEIVEGKQEIEFKVDKIGNVVQKIYNSYVYQPVICFKGGSVKWHEDTVRK